MRDQHSLTTEIRADTAGSKSCEDISTQDKELLMNIKHECPAKTKRFSAASVQPQGGDPEGQFIQHQPYAPSSPLPPFGAPRRRRDWQRIHTECLACCHTMESFPPGFKCSVYDARLTHYFEIPSEWVVPTYGSVRYIEHFNEAGPYSRFRFQLCHNFLNGCCAKGFNCTYIHALQLPPSHEIHLLGVDAYPRLPAGLSLLIHMPGSAGAPQMFPSQSVIRTLGSERLYADIVGNEHGTFVHPQHCAHFLFKKMCNRGPACAFIHTLS
jgi:hypothetical protein